MANRKLKLIAEEPDRDQPLLAPPWKLLIVDDEPEVHTVTRLALSDFRFDGRPMEFINAHTGEQAREILAAEPDIAVMLLDVVMETDDAGLQVVQYVRRILGNNAIRIILRTGHPGAAPERRIIKAFDINDYRAKTELTQDRMHALMYTSLRAYKRLNRMARSRRDNAQLIDEYRETLKRIASLLQPTASNIHNLGTQLAATPIDTAQAELLGVSEQLKTLADKISQLGDPPEAKTVAAQFDSAKLIQQVILDLQAFADARKAEINCDRHLPQLTGHPELFSELMRELLLSALHADDIAETKIDITAEASGKDWVFSISDRANRSENDQLLFKPLHGERQDIGLSRCARILALHGGRIWAETRQGGGRCIHFSIPAIRYSND